MQRAAVLSILKTGEGYTIWLESPSIDQASIPVYFLERDLKRDLAEEIDQAAGLLRYLYARRQALAPASSPASGSGDPLRRLGQRLFGALPAPVRAWLRRLDAPLVISTNDHELPWELLHDDLRFLALSCPVGRRLIEPVQAHRYETHEPGHAWERAMSSDEGEDAGWTPGVRALFIANPTGDLEAAVEEAETLADLIENQPGAHPPRILCHRRATRKAVLGALSGGEHDLIHYAGHAFFDPRDPGASGLILSGDEVLTAREIQESLRGHPVVFLNGCESARSQALYAADGSTGTLAYSGLTARGLASAFIGGGARAFVGALWVTHDDGAHRFARRFYRRALSGETMGEALRWARERGREEAPDDPIWASFALYGAPTLRLVEIRRGLPKPVSILSARIIGLSALCDRKGVESASEIVGKWMDRIHHEIVVHQGEVLSLAHDTATAAFGASVTREDHAELAVRAALAMQGALKIEPFRGADPAPGELSEGDVDPRDTRDQPRPRICIGVDAGDATVRSVELAEGEGISVLGPPFEGARTLRNLAGENQILAGERVYQETASRFNFALFTGETPGLDGGVRAYEVLGTRHKRQRILEFAGSRTELIGREEELAALQTCWNRCLAGHKQVVGVVGDAGVGKSRLLYEFARRVNGPDDRSVGEEERPVWLLGICESHARATPFSWLAQIVRDLFEIDSGDDGPSMAHKLRSALEGLGVRGADLSESVSILGEPLGLKPPAGQPNVPGPQVRQGHLIHYLKGLLVRKASERPVIVVLEDAHWVDDASLEAIRRSMEELVDAPVLLVALYRPGRTFGWEDRRYYHPIPLTGLAEDQGELLLCNLLDARTLPQEVRRPILARGEGNPFFLEEIVASLKETGALVKSNGVWRAQKPLTGVQIPASIRGVLLARIDHLHPESRRVLQAAAVIGRDFPRRILAEITGVHGRVDETDLDARIDDLKQRALVEDTSPPLASRLLWRYTFRHSLTQEVAYGSLPVERRRRYHRHVGQAIERIGEGVEELYPQQRAGYAGLLAHHYYRSVAVPDREGWRVAVDESSREALPGIVAHLVEAGEQAKGRYANREAITFYQQALAVVAELPDDAQTEQVACYEGLGDVHGVLGEFDLALDGYQRAFSLLASDGTPGDLLRAARIAARIGRINERKGGRDNLSLALEWRDKGLALLPKMPTAESALLHALGGIVSFRRADFDGANWQLERSLAMAQEANARPELRLAHSMLSMSLHAQGHLDRAMAHCRISIELDRELSDSIGLAKDLSNQGAYAFEMDDWHLAQESYLKAFEVLERIGDRYQLAITSCNLADLYCHLGDLDRGLSYGDRGLAIFESLVSYQGIVFARAVLSTVCWRMEELERAQAQLLEARRLEDARDVDMFRPTVGRWLAQVYLAAGNVAQAEAEVQALLALDVDVLADEAEPIQHLRGQILAARGEPVEAIQVLYASLARLEEKGMRYQTGRALLVLAGVLAGKDGRTAEAQAHAKRAREIFADLGAKLDLREAEGLIVELAGSENRGEGR